MPVSSPNDEYERFIEICLQQELLSHEDADTLRETVTNRGGWIGQTALQKGILSPTDLDIAESLQYPTRVVPSYEILSLIGRGGMGVVYRARQLDLERTVALKTILANQISNPVSTARFEREAKSLARLQHPNIVQALNFGRHEGRYHFAMEYVEGRTCEQAIRDEGPLPLATVWSIVRQVASGLLHAFNHDLIHRDIKPANLILLSPPEGSFMPKGSEMVKITDFGLAIFVDPHTQDMKLTSSDKLVGSPAYMSPEQFGGEAVDFKTDMYALGATAWHLIFGAPPFQGRSIAHLSLEKSKPLAIELAELPIVIPGEQLSLLMEMISPNPDHRPASYETLIDRVDRFSDYQSRIRQGAIVSTSSHEDVTQSIGISAVAQTDAVPIASPTPNTSAWVSRRSVGAIAGILVLICLLGGIWMLRKTVRGPRLYTQIVTSTPLYDGETLSGWAIGGSMIGAWKTMEAPDASTAIVSTSRRSAITRELPVVDHPRISLFVWPDVHSGTVDIDFAVDAADRLDVRGCLRFSESGVTLGTKNSDFDELKQVPLLSAPLYQNDRYMVVDIERQVDDWYVFLEEQPVGTISFDRIGDTGSLRLVIDGSSVKEFQPPLAYFSDARIENLATP
ncbi:Serine/threonine-protein kinase PrkC [Novipirellula aureliae]|uniref:Serine/threonine-protein kinase PrkC n=1 Tax=Novipirellula aureliae TaxID=2527966 RepID=A0A5C6DUP7_9BACT|nr:serine/threonine-protein kinase [Novipirellula aureliae]TWU38776.1 Serine/threonine-protein kinase PrkC [Novipirellula aureliae]